MLMNSIIMTNMIILTSMKHPISMGTMMIIQTTMMCIQQTNKNFSPWFSYMMFITIIGGMMVMFMYMASIASNNKFKMNIMIFIMWMFMIISIYKINSLSFIVSMEEKKMDIITMQEMKSTLKTFNKPKMLLTILMMMILLITMISVTKISSTFEGPLKNTYV
nr:NADH dehydrogenase subunit 6 [Orthopagus splendens]